MTESHSSESHADAVSRYWDDLVAGRAPSLDGLTQAETDTIAYLVSRSQRAQIPAGARARLQRTIDRETAARRSRTNGNGRDSAMNGSISLGRPGAPPTSPPGVTQPSPKPIPASRQRGRGGLLAFASTGALVVIVGLLTFTIAQTWWGGRAPERGPGSLPAASGSPESTMASTNGMQTGMSVQFLWSASGSDSDQLFHPICARISPRGELWVTDASNRIFIFDLDGNLLEVWADPGSDLGPFKFAQGPMEVGTLTFAPDGTIYVVDTFNQRILHFAADRSLLSVWSSGEGDAALFAPAMLAFEPDGNLLVTDILRGAVRRFDPQGNVIGSFDAADSPDGRLLLPAGIAVGEDGLIYVVETDAGRMRVFDTAGTQIRVVPGLSTPADLAFDSANNLHVSDPGSAIVQVFNAEQELVVSWENAGLDESQWTSPGSIALGRAGMYYVVDWPANRILKFKVTGLT